MLRRIVHEISEEILLRDLERYRQEAVELGETDAMIIRSSDVVVDPRVLAKCLFPKCPVSGTNINCPPHTPDVGWVQKAIEGFQYAIFFKVDGPYEKDSATSHEMKVENLEIVSKLRHRHIMMATIWPLGLAEPRAKPPFALMRIAALCKLESHAGIL